MTKATQGFELPELLGGDRRIDLDRGLAVASSAPALPVSSSDVARAGARCRKRQHPGPPQPPVGLEEERENGHK
jgi:hypothetical protein